MTHNYFYLPYDSIFPKLFQKEKSYLQKIIGKNIIVEHFGSTAVPGLGGKGVVDIYVLVSKDKLKSASGILQKHGYVFKTSFFKRKDHLFHQIDKKHGDKTYHYHIHVSATGSKNFNQCIAFRNYLRTHPESVKKYIRLKKLALDKIKGITDKKEMVKIYLETKGSIIDEII